MSFRHQRIFICLHLVALSLSCQHSRPASALHRAQAYAQQKLWREARQAYEEILRHDPEQRRAHRDLGIILIKFGAYSSGLRHLDKVQGSYPRDYHLHYYRGEAARSLGSYHQGIESYLRALACKPTAGEAKAGLAWSYLKIGELKDALTLSEQLVRLDGKKIDYLAIHARVLLALGEARAALALVRAAKPGCSAENLPYLLSIEGDALVQLKEWEAAYGAYQAALKDNSLLPGPLLGLGKYYIEKKRYAQAIENLEKSVHIKPQTSEGHLLLGSLYEHSDSAHASTHYEFSLQYMDGGGAQRSQQEGLIRGKILQLKNHSAGTDRK
jgi:Flp pilus assembly protein TadD